MANSGNIAIMPTSDWLAICRAINTELGVEFPMCTGDVPDLLQTIAENAMANHFYGFDAQSEPEEPVEKEEVDEDDE